MREGNPNAIKFWWFIEEGTWAVRGLGQTNRSPGARRDPLGGDPGNHRQSATKRTATTATPCSLGIRLIETAFAIWVGRSPEFALRVMDVVLPVRTRRLIEEEVQRQRMEEELAIGPPYPVEPAAVRLPAGAGL